MPSPTPRDLPVLLARHGFRPRGVLGAGVEGIVFDLDDERVAKVWLNRNRADLFTLESFYDALAVAGLAVQSPRIRAVVDLDGISATIEQRLDGQQLGGGPGRLFTPPGRFRDQDRWRHPRSVGSGQDVTRLGRPPDPGR